MQLSASGHPVHTRSLTIGTRVQGDGRWHCRADVIDLRKCGFVPMMTDLQPAGVIHHMTIEAMVDPSTRRLESLETAQPFVAIEPSEATAGECCRDPAPRLQTLVGQTLDAEFPKQLSAAFGGPRGCSHLLTLFQLVASMLPRALDLEAELQARQPAPRAPGEQLFRRAAFLDGWETPDGALAVGVQMADFQTHPAAVVASPFERLAGQWDVRARARVERPSLALGELAAAERERSSADLDRAVWRDRSDRVAPLAGTPILPGLAGRLFRLLPDPGERLLLDALLQLAPGYIQVTAAVMDRWLEGRSPSAGARSPGALREVSSLGGLPDSCYMWRADGPLHRKRAGAAERDGNAQD